MTDGLEDTHVGDVDPLLSRVIAGKMELRAVLGAGAMGVVYRAHHLALDKQVAIKVLRSEGKSDPTRARRFKAEARAASRLDHPNSVHVLDFGEDGPDGLLYLAMEFLEGEDLQNLLKRERVLAPERAARILTQVLGALAAAHDSGVIHRDMKPGNVMLLRRTDDDGRTEDFVKVCDFGLAKILDGLDDASGAPLTKQGAIFGTPAYMAPEQARGEPLDGRADVYACGVILYKMLTGEAPFNADSAWGVLMKHLNEPVPPMAQWVPDVPPELVRITERALAKDRDHRFSSAREMRAALKAYLREAGEDGDLSVPVQAVQPVLRSPSLTVQAAPAPRGSSRTAPADTLAVARPADTVAGATRPSLGAALSDVPGSGSGSAAVVPPARPRALLWAAVAGAVVVAGGLWAARTGTSVEALPGPAIDSSPRADAPRVSAPSAAPRAAASPVGEGEDPRVEGASPSVAAVSPGVAPAVPSGAGAGPPSASDRPLAPRPSSTPAMTPTPTPAMTPAMTPTPTPAMTPTPSASPTPALVPRTSIVPEPRTSVRPLRPRPVATGVVPLGPSASPSASPTPTASPAPTPTASPAPTPTASPAPAPTASPAPTPTASPAPTRVTRVDVRVASVKVTGGLTSRAADKALAKRLDGARRCLEQALLPRGKPERGTADVTGVVDLRGRLGEVTATGPHAKCLQGALEGAVLPKPDTGEARLSFMLEFESS